MRVSSGGEQLVISDVHRADKGVYQCMARNERDSAQASAELRLGGEILAGPDRDVCNRRFKKKYITISCGVRFTKR